VYLPLVDTLPKTERGEPRPLRTPRDVVTVEPVENVRTGAGAKRRILVVEDEAAIRRLAQRILEQAGYVVRTAVDGLEALRIVDEDPEPFDLLLTDVIMPRMSGPELAERVEQLQPGVRVLFTSGYAGDARVPVVTVGTSSNFLSKPYQVIELTEKVHEVLMSGRS
jgi:CheY-like chemotaxis protein